jgi:hypothetical protein
MNEETTTADIANVPTSMGVIRRPTFKEYIKKRKAKPTKDINTTTTTKGM